MFWLITINNILNTDFNTLTHNIYKIATKIPGELYIITSCSKLTLINKCKLFNTIKNINQSTFL